MSQPKKFGTFAGVFTPSILTILGVIMYMRLGWVVGEAGLIAAIGIILLAHIISVTTGLSISSIATDKKIKTGGLYYMLSRSLGLPMGGAIGITLFVGTAFSIALYIIGFCESFLGIGLIRNFLGLELSINDIRIIGTIVIIILVIIAFISTSIAIKIQYFILAAIGLSLISIFASGNLKNPKKSIPIGTLGAIITGLIIYLLIAFGFAFFVNRDLLVSDYNFLLKIAWFSPLVIAGIWGATLSSALGGILGGPRILQAISKDKITPKIFSKGHGKNKEPRNALIFTFLIAEIGILIGDLDIIASWI
jgi:amino acid transporter